MGITIKSTPKGLRIVEKDSPTLWVVSVWPFEKGEKTCVDF